MPDNSINERVATLENRVDTQKEHVIDHETRLRRVERLVFGVIAAAILLGWIVSQANNLAKLIGN